jgi:flagellar motor switch protein FliN/FliY
MNTTHEMNQAQPGGTGGQTQGDALGEGQTFEVLLADVPLEVSVELGRVTLSLRDIAGRLGPGSVITLGKLTGEKLDVRINERLVARGEAVAVGERYGIRIIEVIGRSEGKNP